MTDLLTMKVAFLDARRIWRRIEVPARISLHDLAFAICNSIDFAFDHPFGFYSKLGRSHYDSDRRYELFADVLDMDDLDEGGGSLSVENTCVSEAFPRDGDQMQFLFDYGDEWRLIVTREKTTVVTGPGSIRLIESKGDAFEQYPLADDEADDEDDGKDEDDEGTSTLAATKPAVEIAAAPAKRARKR